MIGVAGLLLIASGVAGLGPVPSSQSAPEDAREVIADVRVHGNVLTPDAEILTLAGIRVGAPLEADTLAAAAARLRDARRFEQVEVLKRFASLDDPTRILVVIIVDEGPVRIEETGDADRPVRVVKVRGPRLMVLPLFYAEDGYGASFGARLAVPDVAGKGSRLSFPLTWGGNKRAAAELSKPFGPGGLVRAEGGAALAERTNPFYEEDDLRRRVWARVARRFARPVEIGGGGEWQHVSFGSIEESFAQGGVDLTVDTRRDPVLARNAVYVRGALARLSREAGGVTRTSLEARGYVGAFGPSILVVAAQARGAGNPLPPYEQELFGGLQNVRGFRAGTAVGDNLVASSVEWRVPLTSPLRIGKAGVSGFADVGTVYAHGEALADQRFSQGVGGSLWLSAAFLRVNLSIAHGIGASTRVHFGAALSF